MRIAYCDCFSGISGDMFLGAMLDAGLPLAELKNQIRLLPLDESYQLSSVVETKKGLRACSFKVVEAHEEQSNHHHENDHHHHRHYNDIAQLIDSSELNHSVKETSQRIFHILAEAEAQVHGTTIDQVHFHEVGALDSIIDIVGAAVGLDYLKIERVYASELPWSGGDVQTEHGKMPLPAPATLQLMKMSQMPLTPVNSSSELVTPTGAAILAALATFERPEMTIEALGVGSGTRDLPWANIFRLIIGNTAEVAKSAIIQIDTNIDDMNPQVYGHVMERLFSAGALDVFITPIYMKKNRPASILSVIAKREIEDCLAKIIFEETTSLGMRVHPVYRYEAAREFKEVQTEYGQVRVKCKIIEGRIIQAMPEYEECQKISKEKNVPLTNVLNAVTAAANTLVAR